ncbi:MAG: hypothetical protein ACYDH9_08030 [Limisphaerales bacterium]
MEFVSPLTYREAVDKLGSRTPIGSVLTSSEWHDVPLELRDRSFFSSGVESVRVLQRSRDFLTDFLTNARDESGALAAGSRAQFVRDMQAFLAGEGIDRTTGGMTDITSERRLGLIFDVQTTQANSFGFWKQGLDPDVLDAFPAMRFVRVQDVKEPRIWHEQFYGQAYLKTDPIWVTINEDFGVPWAPWGWGCGHDVEDVSRAEAEDLGLLEPGQQISPPAADFNDRLEASTAGLDPDLVDKLKEAFGDQAEWGDGAVKWR